MSRPIVFPSDNFEPRPGLPSNSRNAMRAPVIDHPLAMDKPYVRTRRLVLEQDIRYPVGNAVSRIQRASSPDMLVPRRCPQDHTT